MLMMSCPKCGTMLRIVNFNYGIVSNQPEKYGMQCMNVFCGWADYEIKTRAASNTGDNIQQQVRAD